MSSPAPIPTRDRSPKAASRAAALVVAVLAMVVEIAPAVFLMAGAGSLAAVLTNEPVDGTAPAVPAGAARTDAELCLDRSPPRLARIAAAVPDRRPAPPAFAAALRRLDLPPPALA